MGRMCLHLVPGLQEKRGITDALRPDRPVEMSWWLDRMDAHVSRPRERKAWCLTRTQDFRRFSWGGIAHGADALAVGEGSQRSSLVVVGNTSVARHWMFRMHSLCWRIPTSTREHKCVLPVRNQAYSMLAYGVRTKRRE